MVVYLKAEKDEEVITKLDLPGILCICKQPIKTLTPYVTLEFAVTGAATEDIARKRTQDLLHLIHDRQLHETKKDITKINAMVSNQND